MLNRGNEPEDLLETQHLAVFGAKNELETNSILSAKSADQSGKVRFRVPGVGGWGLGARTTTQEAGGRKRGFRVPGFRCQGPEVRLPGSTIRQRYCLPRLAPENVASGTKNPQRGRQHSESSGTLGRGFYFSTLDFPLLDFEKLNELCGNVYENKGPPWKNAGEAGMLLIIKVVSSSGRECC
jgi:hypothetical protein